MDNVIHPIDCMAKELIEQGKVWPIDTWFSQLKSTFKYHKYIG